MTETKPRVSTGTMGPPEDWDDFRKGREQARKEVADLLAKTASRRPDRRLVMLIAWCSDSLEEMKALTGHGHPRSEE